MFITPTDLNTHLYQEIIDVITREDPLLVDACIADAVSEAKGYLSKFSLVDLFGDYTDEDNEVAPTIVDSQLKRIVKDIASWHLVTLANPNVNLELFRTRYEDAKAWLKDVQKGMISPEGWAYKADDPDTAVDESSNIQSSYNPKQSHHF